METLYWLIGAAAILGIALLYFSFLRCAQNNWIGKIPPGPKPIPFLGCLLVYTKTSLLQCTVQEWFDQYGTIFQASCPRQKIIFVHHHQALLNSYEKKQILNTTIRDLVTVLQNFGLSRFKKRELAFISLIWKNHVSSFFTDAASDLTLVQQVAKKIDEVDTQVSIDNGLLKYSPSQQYLISSGVCGLEETEHCKEILSKLSCLILDSPHVWLTSMSSWPIHRINRRLGSDWLGWVSRYLDQLMNKNSIYTEKKFLLLIFLLVRLSTSHSSNTDFILGPDIGGWRSFQCQEYAEVLGYEIPKYSNIYSTNKS